MLVQILIIVFFAGLTIGIGIYYSKRNSGVGDFVLGGRSVGPWLTAFAYGTSYFSSVVFVGYAGQFGWNFGVAATWIGIGNALIGSLLAWVVLGRRTRVMTKHLKSSTMPEFLGVRYLSKNIKIISAIIIFVFLVPYSASVYKGLSGLFALSFQIDFTYCVIGVAIVAGIYVILGGYKATAVNDLIQGLIMLVGIVAVIMAVLNGNGGFTESIEMLSQVPSEVTPELSGTYTSFFGPDPWELLGVVIMTSLGAWGLPQMVHKFYTIKNEKAVRTGTVISTIFAFIIAGGSYFMGAFGRLYYTVPESGVVYDNIVPEMLSQTLPDILIGVVLILVLSASLSTLSSLVITSSSTFTLDILKGLFFKDMSPKSQMKVIKSLCAVFIVISAVLALNPSSLISTLMAISWGALAGSFLGPLVFALFFKGSTRAGVYACFISGIGITLSNYFFGFMSATMAGALAIVASLIIMPLVSIISRKLSPEHVKSVFECYDTKVTISHKTVLKEESEDN